MSHRAARFALPLILGLVTQAAASTGAMPEADIINRVVDRERQTQEWLSRQTPLVETYIRAVKPGAETAQRLPDAYFLGRLNLSELGFRPGIEQSVSERLLLGRTRRERQIRGDGVTRTFIPAGFASMLSPDKRGLDLGAYAFRFTGKELLGSIACLKFDVMPLDSEPGRFQGAIWVEDEAFNIVRFKGIFTKFSSAYYQYVHFDSWRVNVAPGVWVPAFVFSEETVQSNARLKITFRSNTYVWGYAGIPGSLQRIPSAVAEPVLKVRTDHEKPEITPAIARLEMDHLLAKSGPVEKELNEVLLSLMKGDPHFPAEEVNCRILLTSTVELFSLGRTIILSRGLLEALPDEASLALPLARELAHIVLGHTDTTLPSVKNSLFDDPDAFHGLVSAFTPKEEEDADQAALELLQHSPYSDQVPRAAVAQLELQQRAGSTSRILRARFGRSLVITRAVASLARSAGMQPLEAPKRRLLLNPATDEIQGFARSQSSRLHELTHGMVENPPVLARLAGQ